MTNRIKEMLLDMLQNDARYEYKPQECTTADCWEEYHLGESTNDNYDYRKIELFCINDLCGYVRTDSIDKFRDKHDPCIKFIGSEKECAEWLKVNKPSWIKELEYEYKDPNVEQIATIVCKKVLRECNILWSQFQSESTSLMTDRDLMPSDIHTIMEKLGIRNLID